LCELLISDRLKSALPHGPLNYVLSLEGDKWFTTDRVAYLSDTLVNNRALPVVSKAQKGRPARVVTATATVSQGSAARGGHPQASRGGHVTTPSPMRKCYRCNRPGHIAREFDKLKIAGHSCAALNDSGCQIPIVSERMFDGVNMVLLVL